MSRRATDPDIMRLHVRDRLADDGTPSMAERFLSRLDRPSRFAAPRPHVARPGTPDAPLTLDEGLARLYQEHPALAATVDRCCVQGQTLRAAAVDLGVCHRTVRERKVAGLAQLVVWTAIPEANVVAALHRLSTNRGA